MGNRVYYVSRQSGWWNGPGRAVELGVGGEEYADWNGSYTERTMYPHLGEGEQFADPREAVAAAFAIRDAWQASDHTRTRVVSRDVSEEPLNARTLRAWAITEEAELERCAQCHKLLAGSERAWVEMLEPPYNDLAYNRTADPSLRQYYCSTSCCDLAWEVAYTDWSEQERDEWLYRVRDLRYASVLLQDSRHHGRYHSRETDLDPARPECGYRAAPISNEQLVLDLEELLTEPAALEWAHAQAILDASRAAFPLTLPIVTIGA